jgi:hypothetical protein
LGVGVGRMCLGGRLQSVFLAEADEGREVHH